MGATKEKKGPEATPQKRKARFKPLKSSPVLSIPPTARVEPYSMFSPSHALPTKHQFFGSFWHCS